MTLTLQQQNPVHLRIAFIIALLFALSVIWLSPTPSIADLSSKQNALRTSTQSAIELQEIQIDRPKETVPQKNIAVSDTGKILVDTIKDTADGKTVLGEEPVDIESVVGMFVPVTELPQVLKRATPVYPEMARLSGMAGKVWLQVLIGVDGIPIKAVVLKSDGEMFEQPAIDAAMKTIFSPAKNNDQPVKVWFGITYSFSTH